MSGVSAAAGLKSGQFLFRSNWLHKQSADGLNREPNRRASLRARRIQFIAHSRIWSAQRPTLLQLLVLTPDTRHLKPLSVNNLGLILK